MGNSIEQYFYQQKQNNSQNALISQSHRHNLSSKRSFSSSLFGGQFNRNAQFINNFTINSQSIEKLTRQQMISTNYTQELDPLFTTYRSQNKNVYGKYRIFCSNITNQKIQEYKISFSNENDFKTYIVSYFWRKFNGQQNDWPLIKTCHFKIYDESKIKLKGGFTGFFNKNCSKTNQIFCKVCVEDIPLRLCNIKDIPFPENLYVLKQVLKGFKILYDNIGYIKPFEDLICITRKGIVKVWLNSDLSKNYPNIQNIQYNITSSKSQSNLINQILNMIHSNTDPQDQPISFINYLKQRHINLQYISFQKIFQAIAKYSSEFQIQIPMYFSSIVEVLNQEEEQYDTYRTQMEPENNYEENIESHVVVANRNNSQHGLFLDVNNNMDSYRKRKNKNKKGYNSYLDFDKKKKSKQSSSKRKQKTQSLKSVHNGFKSMESSMRGGKSNNLLTQSLPISAHLNLPTSSIQVRQSSSQQGQSRSGNQSTSQIQKLRQQNLRIQNSAATSHNIQNESQSRSKSHVQHQQRKFSSTIIPRNQQNQNQMKKFKRKSQHPQVQINSGRTTQQYGNQNNSKIESKKNILNLNGSNKNFLCVENIPPSPRNKKTQYQQEELIQATQQQMKHMKQIDKYLQEQIIDEQYEKQKQYQLNILQMQDSVKRQEEQFNNNFNNNESNIIIKGLQQKSHQHEKDYRNQQFHQYEDQYMQHQHPVTNSMQYYKNKTYYQNKNKNCADNSNDDIKILYHTQNNKNYQYQSNIEDSNTNNQHSQKHNAKNQRISNNFPYPIIDSHNIIHIQSPSQQFGQPSSSRLTSPQQNIITTQRSLLKSTRVNNSINNPPKSSHVRQNNLSFSNMNTNIINDNNMVNNSQIRSFQNHRNNNLSSIINAKNNQISYDNADNQNTITKSRQKSINKKSPRNVSLVEILPQNSKIDIRVSNNNSVADQQQSSDPQNVKVISGINLNLNSQINVTYTNIDNFKNQNNGHYITNSNGFVNNFQKNKTSPEKIQIIGSSKGIPTSVYLQPNQSNLPKISPPKVRFAIVNSQQPIHRLPSHINFTQPLINNTSRTQFSNQMARLSQPNNMSQISLRQQSQQQSNYLINQYVAYNRPLVQRLANKSHTIVSRYLHGPQSIKFIQHNQNELGSSMLSKPSLVQYSYLKNYANFMPNQQNNLNSQQQINSNQHISSMNVKTNNSHHFAQQRQNYHHANLPATFIGGFQANLLTPLSYNVHPPIQHLTSYSQQNISPLPHIYPINNYPHVIYHQETTNQGSSTVRPQMMNHQNPIATIPQEFQGSKFTNSPASVSKRSLSSSRRDQNKSLNPDSIQQQHKYEYMNDSIGKNINNLQSPIKHHHRRQSSKMRLVSSDQQQRNFPHDDLIIQQGFNNNLQNQNNYFVNLKQQSLKVQQYAGGQHFLLNSNNNTSSRKQRNNLRVNAKVRPSFYSKYSSQHPQSQNYSNYQRSKQNSSGKQNPKISYLNSNQDQPSNLANNQRSYRVVESIEQNRPISTYQDDIQNYNKTDDFIVPQQENTIKGNKISLNIGNHANKLNHYSGIYNPTTRSRNNQEKPRQQSSKSPSGSQSPNPHRFPVNPITGRTMFLNNQNQLNSQFIGDHQSQQQSEMDLTYKSYQKWKDTSKIVDPNDQNYIPSRFHNFNNYHGQYYDNDNNFWHIDQNRVNVGSQRHMNHRQLVKSSIQGLNSNLFGKHNFVNNNINPNSYNTDKKFQDERHYYQVVNTANINRYPINYSPVNNKIGDQILGQNEQNLIYFNQQQIDEEILVDLIHI